MSHKCTCFILTAEDPIGEMVICQEYEDYAKAIAAFRLVVAPKVSLLRQDSKTRVIAQVIKARGIKKGSI